ncbi:hypothetical protein F4678DRAFT_453366 [Xylaria arbuscula]|nr:hypothetical protein F4678DRAFT_453366 [Xylaria arbuscula]
MFKNTAARNGQPPGKRQTSISGFFSKILPSHREERGGTLRSHDMTNNSDSAYIDLGMNPNDLTEWNLAHERPLWPVAAGANSRSQHHRGRSWSIQRGRPRLVDDLGRYPQAHRRTSSFHLAQASKPLEPPVIKIPPQTQHNKPQPRTTDELRAVLKTKEDRRQHRRSLKESGDWLGVQGADPYSGEFAVLTPTSTVSSEATSPATKYRMDELSRRQKSAKLAYEQARLEEGAERERILLQKGRSKLQKMEHAKRELRHSQKDFPTWSQTKRRWSSAAEPVLSPIPQSLRSVNAGGSSDEDAVVATVSVRNFSHPPRSRRGSTIDQPKLVELSGNSEKTEPLKRDRRNNQSTDTIIHKTLPNMQRPDMSIKAKKIAYAPVFSDTSDSPSQEQKDEHLFLWRRRRRMSDPGKSAKRPNIPMIHTSARKTEESLVSAFIERPPPLPKLPSRQEFKNHFPDLSIPDPYLHLPPYVGRMATTERFLTPMKGDPCPEIPTWPVQRSRSEAQIKSALKITTSLSDCPNPQLSLPPVISDTKEAIVISSPLKQKESTKPSSMHRRPIPIRKSSFQAKAIPDQVTSLESPATSCTPNHIDIGLLPKNTTESNKIHYQSSSEVRLREEIPDRHLGIGMNKCYEKDQGESVSTPTIIITGYGRDRDLHLPFDGVLSRTEYWGDGKARTVNSSGTPETWGSHSDKQKQEWSTTTSSRPTTPQSDLQSFVLARETPETDTVSTDNAIAGVDTVIPGKCLRAHRSYENLTNVPMKCAPEKPELIVADRPPKHQHVVNRKQNTQGKEPDTDAINLPSPKQTRMLKLAHQCQEPPGEHREAMIQEAARIAMRRSRAKEVVTTRGQTSSRTPSPRIQDITTPRGAKSQTPAPNGGGDGAGINTGFPLARTSSLDSSTTSPQLQTNLHLHCIRRRSLVCVREGNTHTGKHPRKGNYVERNENTKSKPASIAIFPSLLVTASMVLLGLASAWWVMVRPVFDQSSELWRRRRRRESTLEDVSVFASAAVFCGAGALGLVFAFRVGVWVFLRLV